MKTLYRADVEKQVETRIKGNIIFMGLNGRDAEAYMRGAEAACGMACMIAGLKERFYDKNGNEVTK